MASVIDLTLDDSETDNDLKQSDDTSRQNNDVDVAVEEQISMKHMELSDEEQSQEQFTIPSKKVKHEVKLEDSGSCR